MNSFSSSASDHLKDLDSNGFTILKQEIAPNQVSNLLSLVRLYHSRNASIQYIGVPDRDIDDLVVYGLPCKDYDFLAPIFSERIESILRPKLNDEFYRYMPSDWPNYYLSYYNARSSGRKLDLHIDSYIPSPGSHCWSMQVLIALEQMNEKNGCTIVVPGSHKSGEYTNRHSQETVDLLLDAGDIAIWDSRLWHGTRENITTSTRWALIATFSAWWVKPAMDYTRSLSQDIYSKLSKKEKFLLGFCSIPPKDEYSGINTKKGFESLQANVCDYY
jgi:hypothetical protein